MLAGDEREDVKRWRGCCQDRRGRESSFFLERGVKNGNARMGKGKDER